MAKRKTPEWIKKAAQQIENAGEPQEQSYCTEDQAISIITTEFNKAVGDDVANLLKAFEEMAEMLKRVQKELPYHKLRPEIDDMLKRFNIK